MKEKTAHFRNLLSQGKSLDDLKAAYEGEDCYILLTGPSYSDYTQDLLKEKLKDKLVFCVKQALHGLEDICDFHFWNCSNFPIGSQGKPYNYKLFQRPIVIASSNFPLGYRWDKNQLLDIFVKIPMIEDFGKENCLVFTKNYNDFLFSKNNKRAVGPGIMLETVLYFAVHLGVKSIKTLGWDLNAHGSHFYSEGSVDNKGCEIPWDIKANYDAVPSIEAWLKSHNINLTTISKTSNIGKILDVENL